MQSKIDRRSFLELSGGALVRDGFEIGIRSPQRLAILVPEFALMDKREPMGED